MQVMLFAMLFTTRGRDDARRGQRKGGGVTVPSYWPTQPQEPSPGTPRVQHRHKPGAGTPLASFCTAGGDELARRGLGSRWGPVVLDSN